MKIQSFFTWESAPMNTRTIAGLAMLCGLYVVLNMFSISLSATLEIRFSFIALALSCALYGFWPNVIFAFAADLLGYLVHPVGAYVPLFALVLVVKALIYSFAFYGQDRISIPRILIAEAVSAILANILLNPLLLMWMYQMPYWALVTARLLKNLLMYPIDCALLYCVFRMLPAAKTRLAKTHR